MEPSSAGEPAVRFRPGKKRKAYRQRTDDDGGDDGSSASAVASAGTAARAEPRYGSEQPASSRGDGNDEDEAGGVAAALRLRNARRNRHHGVGFANTTRHDDEASGERSLVLRGADGEPDNDAVLNTITNRFTHQTGFVADLNDKHMMEYIESHLSSRTSGTPAPSKEAAPTPAPANVAPVAPGNPAKSGSGHGAMQGQLTEIDLGDEVRDSNVARTERATQPGMGSVEAEDGNGRRSKKPRLGRDGKPWRPRNRRDSDAIKRDQLVEEILRESRLDVYETPAQQTSNQAADDEDGAADDRLAEEFRQRFLDDVAQRQLKKKKPANQPSKPGSEDVLKGPKLGGSRNVRAAMRDLLLKKEKEGKK